MKHLLPMNLPPSEKGHIGWQLQKMTLSFLLIFTLACLSIGQAYAQQRTITGTVTGENNEGLPGVTVLVKGTTNGTTTDPNGGFSLNVPDGNGTLVVSFIGYQTQEIPVNNRTSIKVTLAPDAKALEEVVVVGYGTQSRGTVTGAVTQIQAKDIARTTATTATGALVGKMQGVTARQADARPGGGTNIQIRNMGDPLYVIDGVVADAGRFNNLNVNDIESVSVLKDASAAIYGLRAANGVVLVTTKKGKAGQKTVINVNGYYGLQDFTRFPRPANAYQHVRALAESNQNRGLANPSNINAAELEKWRLGTEPGYQNNDYYAAVMDEVAPQQYLNASASGGGESMNYYISVGHVNQDAIIKDYNFNRTNFQANIGAGLAKGLRVGTELYGRMENRYQNGVPGLDDYFNPLLSVFSMWPTETMYANNNPKYINQTHNVNVNPATYDRNVTGWIDEVWRAYQSNFWAQYDFDFGLNIKATYSYNFTNFHFNGFEYTYNAYIYNPVTGVYEDRPYKDGAPIPGSVPYGNQNPWREQRRRNAVDKLGQILVTYNKQFGDHGISAVAGFERTDTDNRYNIVHTVPPNNYVDIQYFANQDFLLDEVTQTARAGYIGRFNYNFKQKYLLEVLGRYDGTFLYHPESRWGLFPGVSLGYVISEEPFLKDRFGGVVNQLKLRASYGETGSEQPIQQLRPFDYLAGYDFGSGSAIFDGTFYSGINPRDLPIRSLSWITNTTKNVGVDFTLFDKISGSFDVFRRIRNGLAERRYDVLLPSEVGFALPLENLLTESNRGVEGLLGYRGNIRDVNFSVSGNATFARRYDDYMRYKPRWGNAWDEYRNAFEERWGAVNWGYQVVGQFQSQEEIDNYLVDNDGQGNRDMLPGDLIYKDVNGDKVINALDERPIGYQEGANPYVSFGFNTNFEWKGFNLAIDFAGATMQTFRREVELKIPFQNNGTSPDFMFEDRWHRADPFNADSPWIPGKYPAIRKDRTDHANFRKSDYWMTNVKYIRLRNLDFGYSIPPVFLNRMGISALRVYVTGTNLFSIDNTKEFGLDPEISNAGGLAYPQQKVYTLGFNINF